MCTDAHSPCVRTAVPVIGKSVVMSGRRKFFYSYDLERAHISRVPQIRGREEKSLESMVLSPDNKWIAFLGDAGAAPSMPYSVCSPCAGSLHRNCRLTEALLRPTVHRVHHSGLERHQAVGGQPEDGGLGPGGLLQPRLPHALQRRQKNDPQSALSRANCYSVLSYHLRLLFGIDD